MLSSSWLRNAKRSGPVTRRTQTSPRGRSSVRPRLEAIEDRCLMSTAVVQTNLVKATAGPLSEPGTSRVRARVPENGRHHITPYRRAFHSREETAMVSRHRLPVRFAFASRAVQHRRLRRRPVLEVLESRALLSTFTVNSLGNLGSGSLATRATCRTASTRPTPITRRTRSCSIQPCSARRRRSTAVRSSWKTPMVHRRSLGRPLG